MSQSQSFDPRAEAVAASRHRSGSMKLENIENQPPPSVEPKPKLSSQFKNIRTKFEEKDGQSLRSPGAYYGSNVSKMKELFSKSESSEKDKMETRDRSPESKRKKMEASSSGSLAPALDPRRRTSSIDAPPVIVSPTSPPLSPSSVSINKMGHSVSQPDMETNISKAPTEKRKKLPDTPPRPRGQGLLEKSTSESGLVEPTNHVQRFNYTRALFARMEEETKRAQERDTKVVGRRRLSPPSHSSASTPSPLLSPTALSPVHDAKRFPNQSREAFTRRLHSTSESSIPVSLGTEPLPSPGLDTQSNYRRSHSLSDSTVSGQLASQTTLYDSSSLDRNIHPKRSRRAPMLRDDQANAGPTDQSMDTTEQSFNSEAAFKALGDCFIDRNVDNSLLDNHTRAKEQEQKLSGDRTHHRVAHDSNLSKEQSQNLNISNNFQNSNSSLNSNEAYVSKVVIPDFQSSISHSKARDSVSSTNRASCDEGVVLRDKSSKDSPETVEKKRLSKEEIDLALERADSYLANLSSPDKTEVSVQKERELRRNQSHAESAAARRRFLYGEATGSQSSSNSSLPSRSNETNSSFNQTTNTLSDNASITETEYSDQIASEVSQQVYRVPASSDNNRIDFRAEVDTLSGRSKEDDGDGDVEEAEDGTTYTPPPSYHELNEPPSYLEATNSGSPNRTKSKPQIPSKPVPVPRRVAPPPPLPKKPPMNSVVVQGSRVNKGSPDDAVPPPPAPEPGSRETNGLDISGNRQAVMLDSGDLDDLIMPEEHMKHHQNNIENGSNEVDIKVGLLARESGDGSEEQFSDGEPLELDYSNLTFIEIPPISSGDEDDWDASDDFDYHTASKVSFSRKPIKVYATYSINDYDRRNEDVDPVAASAEYELEKRVEKMDVFPVDLLKGSEGLGLNIIGMGVGADAGLEKLGIFIKTLTAGGAAQRCNKIQVNDQIIEVDGKSLVGVTQAYAASVLRNTSGNVKFLIGREKDPSKSEVARLIQQSLEQDRRRDEMRDKEQNRLKQLEDNFQPKDEVLEHHAHQHSTSSPRQHLDMMETEESEHQHKEESDDWSERETASPTDSPNPELLEEDLVEDITPNSATSNGDCTPDSLEAADGDVTRVSRVTLDDVVSDSSSTPDMESQRLTVTLQQQQAAQKLNEAEAEIVKLKSKITALENAEVQKKLVERKLDEANKKSLERERLHEKTKQELAQYKDMMVASQSQHIELERKMKELGALEKKYHKAKKLIKDYQQREKDFIQERESLMEQQSEKDQQYNSLVKSLKDKIFTLEKELSEAQRVAGLPVSPVTDTDTRITAEVTSFQASEPPLVHAILNGLEEPLSPLNQSTEDALNLSSVSDLSDLTPSNDDGLEITNEQTTVLATQPFVVEENIRSLEFDAVNSSPLLDSTALRAKASVASAANKRPPSKKTWSQDSVGTPCSDDQISTSSSRSGQENGSVHSGQAGHLEIETGLDMWNKHDSHSDTSSSVSQTEYDPAQPIGYADIPEFPDDDNSPNSDGGVTLVSAKSSSGKGFSFPKLYRKSKEESGESGGIVLLSNRSLGGKFKQSNSDPNLTSGGITLISRRIIDTGYGSDGGSTQSDLSPGLMVKEPDDLPGGKFTLNISGHVDNQDRDSPSRKRANQVHSAVISDWTVDHVTHWLTCLELDKYTPAFTDQKITGPQLLQLDGSRLKALGVTNSKDRELLKKKIKEMKANVEREKKLQEKERKQREKEQKKLSKKK